MKKQKKNKFNIFSYLKKCIPLLVVKLLLDAAFYGLDFYATIISARSLEALANSDLQRMIHLVLVVTILNCSLILMKLPSDIIKTKISAKVFAAAKRDITTRLFQISAQNFGENGASSFAQRVLSDPELLFTQLSFSFDLICSSITMFASFVYIMTFNVYIGLIMIGFAALIFVIDFLRHKWSKKQTKELRKIGEQVSSYTHECVRSQLDIKGLDMEDTLKETTFKMHDTCENKKFKYRSAMNLIESGRSIFVQWAVFLIPFVAYYAHLHWALPLVAFLYVFQNKSKFVQLSTFLNAIQMRIIEYQISNERINELFDEEKFSSEKFGDQTIENCTGSIEFCDVHFSYTSRETPKPTKKLKRKQKEEIKITKKPVLHGVSFKINPGESVAFIGRSGAGKSTIASLIPKFYDCESGEVLIDGKNINTLSKQTLRKNISMVNQAPYIFNMSIRDNLLLANKNATEAQIEAALKGASLFEFVSELDKGIDTVVGENGVKLSGGQKQRLAIARALLKDSKIIIFDESTSSLDNFAQEEVRQAIMSLSGNRTVITIAHRLSTIKTADKIFFVDAGKIAATGTFDHLMKNCDEFAKLFSVEKI